MSNSAGDPIGKPTGEMRVPNPLDCRPVVMDRSNTHSSEEEKSKQKQTSHWLRRLRIFANVTLWLLSVLFTAVLIAWLTKWPIFHIEEWPKEYSRSYGTANT